MTNTDLIAEVQERLGLEGPERTHVAHALGMQVLRELARDVQRGQRAIGMVLWHMDPTPVDLIKIAEEVELDVATLKSWMTTYSRLRHEADQAALSFSMQQQLARVQNAEHRAALYESRPEGEWTLESLRSAVDAHLESLGGSVMPKTKKAGCKAKFDDDRQVKVNVELLKDSVLIRLTVSNEGELNDLKFSETSAGVYDLKFSW